MTRETRASIDLAALRHNLAVARRASPNSRILAVIKANAYGHGLVPVARALSAADAFAVSCLEEAIALREAGFAHRIVLLEGFYEPAEIPSFERYRLDCVVHSLWQVDVLERTRVERPLEVWLKIDTGMHRLGVPEEAARSAYARLKAAPSAARHPRLLTHLACADDRNSDFTDQQVEAFRRVTEGLAGERSIGNSAGLLAWPQARSDWVRPGIMLYGASPFADGLPERPPLKPVMTLTSRLISIRTCRRGERVGYAGAFECPEDMPVGVVSIGYGDGYPRHAGTGTPIVVDGRRTQVIGRVSMDMLCVDLRGVEGVEIDAPVVLWGEGLPVEEVADACGTISYELFCKITKRVHFSYRDKHGQG